MVTRTRLNLYKRRVEVLSGESSAKIDLIQPVTTVGGEGSETARVKTGIQERTLSPLLPQTHYFQKD